MTIGSFPALTSLRVLGIEENGDALPLSELAALAGVAARLHRATGTSSPPCPFEMAYTERVGLRSGGHELVLLGDCAFCPTGADAGDRGLWAARGLAGVMLLRRNGYTDLRGWVLAAELLTPPWALAARTQPWAPEWLVALRRRALRRAA